MSYSTMLFKNGERARDFLGFFYLHVSLFFKYIGGRFFLKQLFHLRDYSQRGG